MKQQATENNSTNKKQVGALDQDAQKFGTETHQGKKLVNPTDQSQELSQDIGSRKDKDYPGADEALTGEKPEEKQAAQSKGFGERDASGKTKDVQSSTEESVVEDGENEENTTTSHRSWQAGSNASQAKSSDRSQR